MIKNFSYVISLQAFIGFVLLIIFGVAIFYSLFFMFTTLTFWLQRVFNLEEFLTSVLNFGKAPVQVFTQGFLLFFIFIVPVAFVATFPTQVLLGKSGWELVLFGGIMALIFLFLSNKFWNFALKHYSSASS